MKMCYFFSSFYVSESARLGCVLRPIVHIVYSSFRIDATATLSYVMGDYVFMETPRLALSLPQPRSIDMKDESSIDVKITYPAGPVDPSMIVVYMPNSVPTHSPNADIYGRYYETHQWVHFLNGTC